MNSIRLLLLLANNYLEIPLGFIVHIHLPWHSRSEVWQHFKHYAVAYFALTDEKSWCRSDVIYELNTGRVYVTAYVPDERTAVDLAISVAAGAAKNVMGVPNREAFLLLSYRPRSLAVDIAGVCMTAAWVAAVAAGGAASLITSMLAPLTSTGDNEDRYYVNNVQQLQGTVVK